MPLKTGMHLVMTTQREVKDSWWSGRQVWWHPSTLTTKLVQQQNLAAKQDTGKSHGHQKNDAMEHDIVQY
jgi:hypothetical protein